MNNAVRHAAVFNNLSLKYEGRGFAKFASSKKEEVHFTGRTLEEFDRYYYSRPEYKGHTTLAEKARMNAMRQSSAQSKKSNAEKSERVHNNVSMCGRAPAENKVSTAKPIAPVRSTKKADGAKLPSQIKNEPGVLRRAAEKVLKSEKSPVAITRRNFGRFPAATLVTIVACMMSLILLVGSTVMTGDITKQYSELKSEVSSLANEENKLATELDIKNDLRVIENIALGKLGMVSRDLIVRNYVKLDGEDVIESFDEPKNNIGLSTLLSAIAGN